MEIKKRDALISGYHAARSIINNDNYDELWQEDMLKPMEASHTNRRLFEKLSNNGYEKLIEMLNSKNPLIVKLLGGNDLQHLLKKLYNYTLSPLLRPIIFWRTLAPLYKFLLSLAGRFSTR